MLTRRGSFVAALVLLLAVIASSRSAEAVSRVQPRSSGFQVGMNIASVTDYGFGDLRPYAGHYEQIVDLEEMQRAGATLVRVFVAYNGISAGEAAQRLASFLDMAAEYNVSAIVSFIDFYSSGHNPSGTDAYYTDSWNGLGLLGDSFFASGYSGAYKSFVQTVVTANRGRSNVYAWELGNELKNANSTSLIGFMQDMSSFIRGLDPGRHVATGMLDAHHPGLTPDQLYPYLPNIDVITIHTAIGAREGDPDVRWAVANGKVALVEETGMAGTGDRSPAYAADLDYWRSEGASGFLVWGFIAKGLGDNGDGDASEGMDAIWHTDYDQLMAVLRAASGSTPTVTPTVTSAATRTATPAPTRTPAATRTPPPTLPPTATLPAGALFVSGGSNGQTMTAPVGAVLGLAYEDPAWSWSDSFDPTILQELAPGQLRVTATGQSQVSSRGVPRCYAGAACPRGIQQVTFTLLAGSPTSTATATATSTPTPLTRATAAARPSGR